MTDEEALEYWEKIRKTFMEHYESEDSYWGRHHWMTSVQAVDAAISALRDRIARQNPQPLTLAELRKMDGEPVYLAITMHGGYGLVNMDDKQITLSRGGSVWIDNVIGYAYRTKPEVQV